MDIFTQEQKARIKAIIRELLPEIATATMNELLVGLRAAQAVRPEPPEITDDLRLIYKQCAADARHSLAGLANMDFSG